MQGFAADIQDQTKENGDFRHILDTCSNLQLAVMSLKPGEDIGAQTHATHDQFFRIPTLPPV